MEKWVRFSRRKNFKTIFIVLYTEEGESMMKKFSILTCIMFLFFVGCSNSNTNTNSKGYVPSETDIVSRNSGEIINENKLKEFIQNTETGEKDVIRVVTYTKEGDPILKDLAYDGEKLEVTRDNTRDEYGNGEIKTFKCESIIVEGKKYSIVGCEGYEVPYYLAESR